MRILLITSSKGGTGKTATAINLAALHAAESRPRVLLVDADPAGGVSHYLQQDLNDSGESEPLTDTGIFWPELLNKADVISPYAPGSSSQYQLEHFLKILPEWAREQRYETIILDAPPMLGARAKALLRCATEVLLVQRAEPLGFQQMSAYLELAKRETPPGQSLKFLGILLTLGMGQRAGDPSVELLRRRFKGVLPTYIPYDPQFDEAVTLGQPVVSFNTYAAASKAYTETARLLELLPPISRVKSLNSPAVKSGLPSTP